MSVLGRLMHRRRPVPEPDEPDEPGERVQASELRYVYRVVVDGEVDDKLLVRDEPVTIEAEVPFRDRTVVVEEIEDLHEKDRSGNDLGERLEAKPEVQIARTLVCREVVPVSD
jgi:hypothetical protein